MTILKIFKPEDSDEVNPITTLCEGEYFVGRDKLLDCHDRRVSRKHALIQVKADGVTLTSVHVNPCYFKSSTENLIQLIKKDSTITLENGDQFALLIDLFWYKVKVVLNNDATEENGTCTSTNNSFPIRSTSDVPVTKRNLDHSDADEKCKRLKTHDVDEQTDINNIASTSVPRINTDSLINNLNLIINEDYGDTSSTIAQNRRKNDANETMPPISRINAESPQNENEPDHSVLSDNIHNNTTIENPRENTVASTVEDGFSQENIPQEIPSGQNVPYDIPIENIKKEVVENEADDSENAVNDSDVPSEPSASSRLPSVVSADNIKKEAPDRENDARNGDSNGPSGSSDNRERRDRCWYGQSCYRKNPTHRSNFSHPGDEDYDSDPNDDRPVCPFGAACYRVNMEHRRKFKHFGRPAPKPSNVNIRIDVNCACPFCSHCGNNRGKPGYESDYDSDSGNEL